MGGIASRWSRHAPQARRSRSPNRRVIFNTARHGGTVLLGAVARAQGASIEQRYPTARPGAESFLPLVLWSIRTWVPVGSPAARRLRAPRLRPPRQAQGLLTAWTAAPPRALIVPCTAARPARRHTWMASCTASIGAYRGVGRGRCDPARHGAAFSSCAPGSPHRWPGRAASRADGVSSWSPPGATGSQSCDGAPRAPWAMRSGARAAPLPT